jgi:hypothetical protein
VSAEKNPGLMIALVTVAVTVSTAVMVVGIWGAWKDTERAEGDARYRRRVLLRMVMLYVFCAVFGIAEVASRREPIESLFGLPIAAFLAWMYWRAAVRVNVPPHS